MAVDSISNDRVTDDLANQPIELASERRTEEEQVIRPANTFHTTSMQLLGQRKTLGVKRSMGGWAARGRGSGLAKGFEVPRRVEKGG